MPRGPEGPYLYFSMSAACDPPLDPAAGVPPLRFRPPRALGKDQLAPWSLYASWPDP